MAIEDKFQAFENADLIVTGRLVDASNATLFAHVLFNEVKLLCIYKPIAGERPLWDFVGGSLAQREYAAFRVSEYLSLDVVPFTVLRDGPYGTGMVQEWISIDDAIDLGSFFASDHPRLRIMALFDAIINNTDRKIGHLLPVDEQHVYGCDHGVTFHVDDKLRTVLWQWAGVDFNEAEIAILERAQSGLATQLREILLSLISADEISAMQRRVARMLVKGEFPKPSPNWPAVPWPAF